MLENKKIRKRKRRANRIAVKNPLRPFSLNLGNYLTKTGIMKYLDIDIFLGEYMNAKTDIANTNHFRRESFKKKSQDPNGYTAKELTKFALIFEDIEKKAKQAKTKTRTLIKKKQDYEKRFKEHEKETREHEKQSIFGNLIK